MSHVYSKTVDGLRALGTVTRRVFLGGLMVALSSIGLFAFAGCAENTTDVVEGTNSTGGTNGATTGGTSTGVGGAAEVSMAASLQPVGGTQIVRDSAILRSLGTNNSNRHGNEPILLVHVAADQIAANTLLCTHKACPVRYDARRKLLVCPCHGAAFDLDGRVVARPAKRPLIHFKATIVGESVRLEKA